MLQKLHILNYAIIDEIEIDFSSGLNIITGETGAGKSILMGALALILGQRADSSILRQKEKKMVVEGFFKAAGKKEIKRFLKENELDPEEELVIRREISPGGKSRAFINDTPVNLNQLKELSLLLVDLHQQFDALELGDNNFQLQVLDALASNSELLAEYTTLFNRYTIAKKQLEELKQQQEAVQRESDYNTFLFDELEEAGLKENDLEELDAELKLLSNAENVKQQLLSIFYELKDADQPLVQQLKLLSNRLNGLAEFHLNIPAMVQRIQSCQAELQDIADELETINEGIHYSQERIQIVNDKIALGYKLLKKHHVSTTNELLAIKDVLQLKLEAVLNISEEIAKKDKEKGDLLVKCEKLVAEISYNRKKAVIPFEEKTNLRLTQVGMPNAKLKVMLEAIPLNMNGADAIDFLFDANKTNRFEPLQKVASGGELSRLMLCIKSLVAQKLQLPTLIFDEIDTGISGEAAKQVGIIMKSLSLSHQVISITHQPQIAARAQSHYFVYKTIKNDKIVTSIRLLSNDERITNIAQMLSGEKPTAAALENAREMVGN
jgi:DNA repair protein RecN (Recombination protein N)